MLHSLLKRQLKRTDLSESTPPTAEEWLQFLERMSRHYQEMDQERYLLERSLTISSREMQEMFEQLRQSETRYALAAQGANDGLWDWNLITNEVYYSPRLAEIIGGANKEIATSLLYWFDRIHPDDRGTVEAELSAHLEGDTKHFQNEHRVLHYNGSYRWVLIRGLAVRNKEGVAHRIAGSLTDITERKFVERQLAHDAMHDSLTELPNRAMFMERLARSLKRVKHNNKYSFAVLFLDLDRFKIINDSLGHAAGDQLLLEIARKLTNLIRPGDLVARLGGDEFVIFLDNIEDKSHVTTVAERVQREISLPLTLQGQEVYTSASIGIAFSAPTYEQADNLLRDADIAMYKAKLNGKARFEIFDQEMHSQAVSLLHLENDLRRAVQRREFYLHYQPIVSLPTGQMLGFEALARWDHPTRGLIPPGEFIPMAEDTGLILPIGQWVLHEACRQMQSWREQFQLPASFSISVNLSARQLELPDITDQIIRILQETKLSPQHLKIEITESVIMANADHAIAVITKLRDLGVGVSIDDFGTGYSSLSYLHQFPIDTLKVDRSFINRIGVEGENTEIIRSIVLLAHNLGIEVVAEGVETPDQLNYLRQMKCAYGQGYFYSRPVDDESATKLIQEFMSAKPAKKVRQSTKMARQGNNA